MEKVTRNALSLTNITTLLVETCPSDSPCADGDRCCKKESNSYGTTLYCDEKCQTPMYNKCRDNSKYTLKLT